MKVLSITEPMATLICLGKKRIETRSWKTNYRGKLYIHASLTKIRTEWKNNNNLMNLLDNNDLNYGKIICKCDLVDCIYMDEDFINKIKKDEQEYLCGIYELGRYAWVLDNIEILGTPIDIKGHLGIWNYGDDINDNNKK